MSEEEIEDILAIYIMAFGKLNYEITLRAIGQIMLDEEKMKQLYKAPIPTITRESVKLTQFTEAEKRKHRELQETYECHYPLEHKMEIVNKSTHQTIGFRPLTDLEEDYYNNGLMGYKEYHWWKWGQYKGEEKPKDSVYDPITRTRKQIKYDY